MSHFHTIFLGLGSNLPKGELGPAGILHSAVHRLMQEGVQIVKTSALYETPPFPTADQPYFVNAVVEGKTDRDPDALLHICQKIEKHFSRQRQMRWSARTLDIDILAFGRVVSPQLDEWHQLAEADDAFTETLVLPHPRMHRRMFVMVPLAEIAPDWLHPSLNRRAGALLQQIATPQTMAEIKRLSRILP